jgi:putative membrane protein
MLSLTSTGTELRRFRRGLLPQVAIGALILIPLLYGALYLWAFWNPTGGMDKLPVALVNADQPATTGDGETVHAGQNVAAELLASADLDWVTTDAQDAADGVRHGRYYFALTIPEEFSTDVVSAGGDAPAKATLQVTYNDANSFLASTLGRSAMQQVDQAVSAGIGAQTVDRVLVGLADARSGITQAADGATALETGGSTLATGAHDLATGAATAASGAGSLADGARSAASGSADLAAGATAAADGAAAVSSGATDLKSGLDKTLAGSTSLATGAAQLSAGVDTAVSSIGSLSSSLAALPPALTDVATYLQGRLAVGDMSAAAPLTELAGASKALGSFDPAATAADLARLRQGAASVATGSAALSTAVGRLDEGSAQLSAGAGALATGTAQVADGAASLADGTSLLATGSQDLASGTTALAAGADQVASGADQLVTGSGTLAAGLTAGAAQIPDDTTDQQTARADVLATPVGLSEDHLTKAEGFGEGFAPFFIPLALFVGALITWLLLRPLPTRALATPASGVRATLAGYLPAAVIGLAQVAVMLAVIHVGVGLQMASVAGTIAFTCLIALTFLALQQMLNAVFGPAAGKVIILALLMLQLASSGGTYPVETTPTFFHVIHPLLPMSYAVDGLRLVITGGADGRLVLAVVYLLVVLVGSLAVTSWRAGRMRTWTLARLHPALEI